MLYFFIFAFIFVQSFGIDDGDNCNSISCPEGSKCCYDVCCPQFSTCCRGNCYIFNITKAIWGDSEIMCNQFKNDDGYLSSIANSVINDELTKCAYNFSNQNDIWWIGYYQNAEKDWISIDGTESNFSNWFDQGRILYDLKINQPNKYINGRAAISVQNDGFWYSKNNDDLENLFPFICKLKHKTIITTQPSSSTSITTPNSRVSSSTENRGKSSSKWWLWLIVGGILLFIIGILIIIYFLRKRFQQKKLNNFLQSVQTEMLSVNTQLSHDQRKKYQLNPKNMTIYFNDILGKGTSATVYKVYIKSNSNDDVKNECDGETCYAAIKICNSFNKEKNEEFNRELDTLIRVGGHENVINFVGWTLYHKMPSLITELASGGNLLQYVTSFRNEVIPINTGISILWQISQALEYVASLKLVHRDVACRNILLTEKNVAKLSDFGLCCHCDDETLIYQGSLHKRMPIKWLSIEALVDRKFSEKSDVWAFGILCYEIFSYGAVPYPAMTNMEMLEFLQAGNRLQKPPIAPEEIYAMMLDCWKEAVEDRPTFSQITNYLRRILEKNTENYGYLSFLPEEPKE